MIRRLLDLCHYWCYQHSSAIYLRSNLYSVVKISFHTGTEHCCQVCILSMMFCCSDCRLCADRVSDSTIRKIVYNMVWLHSNRPTSEVKKYILYIWFSHFTLTVTHRCYNYSMWYIKKILPCWPICWQSKPSLKLLDCGRKIENDIHIYAYYCKPELIPWR